MLGTHTLINGRYRLLRLVGSGGMGSVYAARDERLGRDVALKLLRPDLAADPRARERFLREAQIAAQLIHPNIVRTYDVGDAPEGPYLVQELLTGRTLDQLMPLPAERALAVAIAVTDALQYIHERGYVHCDIKPHNIMLLGDAPAARVVLLDFGIARVAGTDTTTLIATPHYLAPERLLGEAASPASDLYALGIVLYQMLTGTPPFDGPSMQAILEQHRQAPLPPLPTGDPLVQRLEPIIRKLAAKQPTERYHTAAEARRALEHAAHAEVHALPTLAVTPRPAAPTAARAPRPPRTTELGSQPTQRLWLLALPVLLALLLLGTVLTNRSAEQAAPASEIPPPGATPTPAPVTVPDVLGLPLPEAQRIIEASGLRLVVGERLPANQKPDTVLTTQPAAGAQLVPGSDVVAQLSAGPPAPAADDDDKEAAPDKGKGKDKDKGKGKRDD